MGILGITGRSRPRGCDRLRGRGGSGRRLTGEWVVIIRYSIRMDYTVSGESGGDGARLTGDRAACDPRTDERKLGYRCRSGDAERLDPLECICCVFSKCSILRRWPSTDVFASAVNFVPNRS